MIKRTYWCNVCHVMYRPDKLVGIGWDYVPSLGREGIRVRHANGIRVRHANHVKDHVCLECLEDLARIAGTLLGGGDVPYGPRGPHGGMAEDLRRAEHNRRLAAGESEGTK